MLVSCPRKEDYQQRPALVINHHDLCQSAGSEVTFLRYNSDPGWLRIFFWGRGPHGLLISFSLAPIQFGVLAYFLQKTTFSESGFFKKRGHLPLVYHPRNSGFLHIFFRERGHLPPVHQPPTRGACTSFSVDEGLMDLLPSSRAPIQFGVFAYLLQKTKESSTEFIPVGNQLRLGVFAHLLQRARKSMTTPFPTRDCCTSKHEKVA